MTATDQAPRARDAGKPRHAGKPEPAAAGPASEAVREFQSDALALEERRPPLAARITLFTLLGLMAAAITWASIAEVDRIVEATGRLVTTEPTVVLNPLERAVVRRLAVRPGDRITKGEIVASFDPTFARSEVADLEGQLWALDAHSARLEAEMESQPFQPAGTSADLRLQKTIFDRRQAEYHARVRSLTRELESLRETYTGNLKDRDALHSRLEVVNEIVAMRTELAASQVGSRLQLLDASAAKLTVQSELSRTDARSRELIERMAALAADLDSFQAEWPRKVAEEFVEVRQQRASITERLTAARRLADLDELVAPVDGVVLEVADVAPGAVIREVDPLVTIVPLNSPLEAEVTIQTSDIGLVRPQDRARIKLEAFPFQRHGTLEGELRTISEDAIRPSGGNDDDPPYYRAMIRLTKTELRDVPQTASFRLLPGMRVTAEIKVGQRSVISFFLYPIIRGLDESIREP